MEKVVEELRKIFSFKEDTAVGDIVLIVADEPQTLIYGYVKDIKRDVSKQDEWWHVTMLLLSIPPQLVIWTLRHPQFTGQEIFTMGGDKRFMKAIDLSAAASLSAAPVKKGLTKKSKLRVVK